MTSSLLQGDPKPYKSSAAGDPPREAILWANLGAFPPKRFRDERNLSMSG
ncbi:hypothetical protein IAD21_04103 [Abditibacteriota bacterium]|nr:hypothetical protein IAD21_04103 [Abditibacteriota bacterium]